MTNFNSQIRYSIQHDIQYENMNVKTEATWRSKISIHQEHEY